SSRRRHTRSKRDWSSDVCSSDLLPANGPVNINHQFGLTNSGPSMAPSGPLYQNANEQYLSLLQRQQQLYHDAAAFAASYRGPARSEERRVGKEWMSGGPTE